MAEKDRFDIPPEELERFCRKHGIRRLSLFGSVLGEKFGPDSDIDVLVEFEPGARVGLVGMARIERELSERLGRPIDLRTPGDLSRYFRADVVREAEVRFDAG